MSILEAARLLLPDWAHLVIAGDPAPDSGPPLDAGPASEAAAPLLFAGELGGRRVAVLAFDLHRSDLPLQVAFPLLLANLIDWLAPQGSQGGCPCRWRPVRRLLLSPPLVTAPAGPSSQPVAVVTRPDGSTVRLSPVRPRV